MDSHKLTELVKAQSGSVKSFCEQNGIKYTTFYTAIRSDQQLNNMNVSMFITAAHGLGMTADELIEKLKTQKERL